MSEIRSHVGERIGDFELLRFIGRGGMGEVWEARQRSVDRRVALKLLPMALGQEPRAVLRFHREAQAGARLSHSNIATVYSAGIADGQLFIAQELVLGNSLAEWIRALPREAPLPPEHFAEVVRVVQLVALALEYAHGQGVIHRDVKPQNILIAPDGQPKLVDFGLAQMDDGFVVSQSGEVAGTYAYMSPEQARARSSEVDHRTDVFSLGVTLYELLTLERPFSGDSAYEVTDKILHEAPRHPCGRRPEVPATLAETCLKALQKEKADRFPSMLALAEQLVSAERPTRLPAIMERANSERRRWRARWTVLAGAALGSIGAVWLVATRTKDEPVADRPPVHPYEDFPFFPELQRFARARVASYEKREVERGESQKGEATPIPGASTSSARLVIERYPCNDLFMISSRELVFDPAVPTRTCYRLPDGSTVRYLAYGLSPEDLSTLVMENVEVGTWENDGVSITVEASALIVWHSSEAQLKVEALLAGLRRCLLLGEAYPGSWLEVEPCCMSGSTNHLMRLYPVWDLTWPDEVRVATLAKSDLPEFALEPGPAVIGEDGLDSLIRDNVEPASWESDLTQSIRVLNGLLVVQAPASVQDKIARLLAELRDRD